MPALVLKSTAFSEGEEIPKPYTCQGADLSPPLHWQGTPAGTKTWALIVDDPDAPAKTWVHWLLWNIPHDMTTLPEGASGGGPWIEGTTDFRRNQYNGPCPPEGHGPHRYHFRVFALDTRIDLDYRATRKELERAMAGHVIGSAVLIGTYERQPEPVAGR